MSTEKLALQFEDVDLPKFYELVTFQHQKPQISAYAEESLTALATHLRCALVIGGTTCLPLKVQAPAIARLLSALAEDFEKLAQD